MVPSLRNFSAGIFKQPINLFLDVQIKLRTNDDVHLPAKRLAARWNAASNFSRDNGSAGPLAMASSIHAWTCAVLTAA